MTESPRKRRRAIDDGSDHTSVSSGEEAVSSGEASFADDTSRETRRGDANAPAGAGSERFVDSPERTSAERSSADDDVIASVEIISRFETH